MENKAVAPVHPLSLKQKLIVAFIATTISGVIALAGAEIAIRHTSDYVTPEILKNRSLQYVGALFARHVFPQKELRAYNDQGIEGLEYYINERGYRGRDFSVPKPEGTIRVLIYGGSAAFDLNLPEGRDWPHRIETIVRQNGYPEVEVINAGIPGHASFDCFGRLFAEGHLFNPDYVISYNAWNDIKYFRSNQPLLRAFPPFWPSRDPRVDYRNRLDRLLCEHSQLYVRVRHRYIVWRLGIRSEGSLPKGPRSSEITDTALRQYYLNQVMFVDLAREIGAIPILMTEARLTAPDNSESQKSLIEPFLDYVKLDRPALLKSYDRIEAALRRISSEKNVELFDVSKDLDGKDEFFTDIVHLTPEGSEKLAQATAQKLIALLKTRESEKAALPKAAP